jgi:hypothetical protein
MIDKYACVDVCLCLKPDTHVCPHTAVYVSSVSSSMLDKYAFICMRDGRRERVHRKRRERVRGEGEREGGRGDGGGGVTGGVQLREGSPGFDLRDIHPSPSLFFLLNLRVHI